MTRLRKSGAASVRMMPPTPRLAALRQPSICRKVRAAGGAAGTAYPIDVASVRQDASASGSPAAAARGALPGSRWGRGGRLTEMAYQHVRDGILRGDLPAGRMLLEGDLAESLHISRTPVQHALKALLQEGLLEVGPRRKMVVRGVSVAHREELLDVREALERLAVRRACRSMPVEEFDQLHLLLLRQRRAAEAGDDDAFIELDEEFHLRIATGAALTVVPKVLRQLGGMVRLMRAGTRRYAGHLFEVLDEHEALLDALERRDEGAAVEALTRHLHTSDYVEDEGRR
jgi:GntR family transcriptional regulator, rspAB operon transcriptional repressor